MKKRIAGIILLCLAAVFLGGCSLITDLFGGSDDDDHQEPDNPIGSSKTWVRFVNGNEFSVSVYSDRSRLTKLADVKAGANSASIEINDPSNSEASFYPTYHIVMEGVDIPYEGREIVQRIDAGKPTESPNVVTVWSLTELEEAELSKPLSDAVYLKIHNAGSSSLVLGRGRTEEIPQGANSSILNGGETGLYMVNPGPVSDYSVKKNTSIPVNFPGTMTDFVRGHLYSFRFDGNNLILAADKPLTWAQAFALSPPEIISARPLSSGSIALSWDKAGTETAYRIYRAVDTPDVFTLLKEVTVTSYTDSEVTLNKTYHYKISSIKKTLESEKSAIYASARAELVPLAAPTGLTATAQGTDSIRLSWSPAADATGYKVYQGSSAAGVSTYVAAASSTTYTVNGLSSSTGYYFAVSSVSGAVESDPSSPVYGETSAEPAIQPPGGISASAQNSSSILITWNAVSGATGYKVYRSGSSGGSYGLRGETASVSYTDNGLSAGSTWYYKVSSVGALGEGELSASYASATTPGDGGTVPFPPSIPQALTVSGVSAGSITLSWNQVSTADSYNIYRANTQSGAESKIAAGITGTSYINSGIPEGSCYYYRVTGVNSSGEGAKSNTAFAYASTHYQLAGYGGAPVLALRGQQKHYYRLQVVKDQYYTIEWQNGSGGEADAWRSDGIHVSAWQSNGVSIFSGATGGKANPRNFKAAESGYLTIEVSNGSGDTTSYNYQIYYY